MSIEVRNCSAKDLLEDMDDNTVDLITTDPPYGIDVMGTNWDSGEINKRIKRSENSVVKGIPVGMKFNPEDSVKLQEFLEPIFLEYFRVLKPGGFCLVFSQSRSSHRVGLALENSGFELREQLFWDYGTGQQKAQSVNNFVRKNRGLDEDTKKRLIKELDGKKTPQLAPCVETIWLAQKPKEGNTVENYIKWGTGLVNFNGDTVRVRFEHRKPNKNERDLLLKHPTQKPLSLFNELIYRFSNVGDVVLDTFLGTGTTAISCMELNRSFIGCEIDEDYCGMINDRIKKCN